MPASGTVHAGHVRSLKAVGQSFEFRVNLLAVATPLRVGPCVKTRQWACRHAQAHQHLGRTGA